MQKIMNTGKPLFLVGTVIEGHVTVTDLWTGRIITAADPEVIAGLDRKGIISVVARALTECGFPITRVTDHSDYLRNANGALMWSMHGPATYSDFKIEYDPELHTAVLIRKSGDVKIPIEAWSNVDGPYRLSEFYGFAVSETRKFGHTTLNSFLDENADMQLVAYRTALTVCPRAIFIGGLWQVLFAMSSFTAISSLLEWVGILTFENPNIIAWFAVMAATFFGTLPLGKRIANGMQNATESGMAFRSRRMPRNFWQ